MHKYRCKGPGGPDRTISRRFPRARSIPAMALPSGKMPPIVARQLRQRSRFCRRPFLPYPLAYARCQPGSFGFVSFVARVRARGGSDSFPSARFSVTPKIMKKSIKVTPKKRRGRPATGRDPHVTSRMPTELIVQVEAWATANDTSRSDAFRRLVELGLKTKALASRQPASLAAGPARLSWRQSRSIT
jgi:hypothetical protein